MFSMTIVTEPQATQQAPAPPAAPGTPGTPGTDVVITTAPEGGVTARVIGAREIRAIKNQRSELSDQLISAASRRADLAKELESATGSNRAGIEARIELLDKRILDIESEIASTGRLLVTSLANTQTSSTESGGMPIDGTAIAVVFTLFVLAPIAIAMARLLWRRASSPKSQPTFERENNERLQRLEGAVDSIAIEVERISEGQRFVTKLLAGQQDRAKIESSRE